MSSVPPTGTGGTIAYGNVYVSQPQKVAGGLAFAKASLGMQYACGIATTGAAYCWGSNREGALGNASQVDQAAPARVTGRVNP